MYIWYNFIIHLTKGKRNHCYFLKNLEYLLIILMLFSVSTKNDFHNKFFYYTFHSSFYKQTSIFKMMYFWATYNLTFYKSRVSLQKIIPLTILTLNIPIVKKSKKALKIVYSSSIISVVGKTTIGITEPMLF